MSRKATVDDMVAVIRESDKPVVTKQDIADGVDVSWQTINNHEDELHEDERVESDRVGKATVFWLKSWTQNEEFDGGGEYPVETGDCGCYAPECNDDPTEEYQDAFGNTLPLCKEHYYEAIHPTELRTITQTVSPKTRDSNSFVSKLSGGEDNDDA